MTDDRAEERQSHADMVLAAAKELHAHGQLVTREALMDVTGLKLTIIDDRVKHLTDVGLINKRQRGVYEPVEQFGQPRTIYHAILPGGMHKIEIGDDCVMTLSPQESRTLGHMMAGAAFAFQTTELAHQAIERNNEISRQVRTVVRKVCRIPRG